MSCEGEVPLSSVWVLTKNKFCFKCKRTILSGIKPRSARANTDDFFFKFLSLNNLSQIFENNVSNPKDKPIHNK